MELVTPAIGLIFWTTVVFSLLIILLKKFAWQPILKAVEKRNSSIEDALRSAEKAKEEMAELTADNERILNKAKRERDALLKEAREIKEKVISDAKAKARSESEKILTTAKEQILNEKMAAITELKNHIGKLSIDIAEKILKSELKDLSKQKEFISTLLQNKEVN